MSRSRVVQVKDDGELLTYGRSDFDAAYGLTDVQPVDFSGFPVTVEEARKRAWHVWRDGFVDLADTLGHEEFTKAWRVLERQAARSIRPGCIVLGAHLDSTGWKMSASCTLSSEESADVERKQ